MYSCDECDAQFKTKEEFWKHFCESHQEREGEEEGFDPKEDDVDESNGEGNETQTAESKDVSNTSEQNMAFTGSIHDDNCDTGDQVISSKEKLEKHMAKKHKQRRK